MSLIGSSSSAGLYSDYPESLYWHPAIKCFEPILNDDSIRFDVVICTEYPHYFNVFQDQQLQVNFNPFYLHSTLELVIHLVRMPGGKLASKVVFHELIHREVNGTKLVSGVIGTSTEKKCFLQSK